ncbi:hypothetical protein [Spirosoma areae]
MTIRAEGPEHLDPAKNTYSVVLGDVVTTDITVKFTVGQPLPFEQTYSVPTEYQANGQLLVINALVPGIYPMGYQSKPTPTGATADVILNLPAPQLYSARLGSLTITESTLIKT